MAETQMLTIVKNALKLLGIIDSQSEPSAADAVDVLDRANGLLAQLAAKNIYTGADNLVMQDLFPLEAKHRIGFEAYLARECASLFGVVASADVQRQAEKGWQLIAADYFAPEPLRVDIALQYMPSQRRYS